MKINNKTHWNTQQLRALIQAVAVAEVTPEHRRRLQVEIVYKKKHWRRCGLATVRGAWLRLYLDRKDVDAREVAMVTAHELAHNRGLDHRNMDKRRYRWGAGWQEFYEWALAFPIERQAAKPKPDVQVVRYLSVLARQKAWQTKLKRAQTALKKLHKQRRYYEKALTAANKMPEADDA